MGIFSWLFPSTEDKINKARKLVSDGRYAEARLQLLDIDDDGARALLSQTQTELVKLNLHKAIQRARAGDSSQVDSHLALAEQFHDGTLTDLFDETKSKILELGEAGAIDAVWDDLEAFAHRRARLGTDPGDFTLTAYSGSGSIRLFFGGDRPFNLPSLEFDPHQVWFKPSWFSTSDGDVSDFNLALDEAYKAADGAHLDSSRDVLHGAIQAQFAEQPEQAVLGLLEEPRDNPAIAYELGRASAALGCYKASILCFEAAEEAAGGPFIVSDLSTRFWIAVCSLWDRDLDRAADALDELDHDVPAHLLATVYIESGRLERASSALETIAEDDDERPQLDGAFRLADELETVFRDYPIIKDPEARGTEEWNLALEAGANQLQAVLDSVLGDLEALADTQPI
ncbi:MAG: hypothetical protein CMH52_00575 [Myxococcales bacterium]|nr:hypothetical protein [Myxococcales bacterium]|tara:strand:+ start:557 stop:1753 length:1197 start_codon:yes stop_codon:yes gene_type:complete